MGNALSVEDLINGDFPTPVPTIEPWEGWSSSEGTYYYRLRLVSNPTFLDCH